MSQRAGRYRWEVSDVDESIKKVVNKTISEVFEMMFFTFLEPLTDVPPEDEWGENAVMIRGFISYKGDITGDFLFYFPKNLARNITVNFLGVAAEELDDHKITDTTAEAVNMVVGSLLGKLDPGGTCTLGIPEATIITDFSPETVVNEPGLCLFSTEHGLLWVVNKTK